MSNLSKVVNLMLNLSDISYSVAGRQILNNVNLQISEKQRIGLVGRNGCGKSTLLKIILGQKEADAGKVQIESGRQVLSVRQEIPTGDISPRDYLLSQDKRRNELLQKLEDYSETQPELVPDIYDELISINAFDAESRAAVVLKGLGFSEEEQNLPLDNFSGGYRMRIALGAILYQEPDLLLLDEPTNHLDLETVDWLTDFLKSYTKSFIVISHDRDFLNSIAGEILHLKGSKLTRYKGNFDTFLDTYLQKQKNIREYNAKMEEKKEHMLSFIRRFGVKATKAKQAQSKLKAIEKMKFIPVEQDDPTVKFNFPDPTPALQSNIITFDKVCLGYGERTVLRNVSGSIMSHDRIALVGANGNGKSTFVKFLAGELKQKRGTITRHPKLRIGFYHQDVVENLQLDSTPYAYLAENAAEFTQQQIRNHLGRFGFSDDKIFIKIDKLSGGEKARLIFAGLTVHAPNMLILDEPTNNLDLEMRESLEVSLNNFDGAIVLITHDRTFLNNIADSIFVVADQTVSQYNNDVSQYENYTLSKRKK